MRLTILCVLLLSACSSGTPTIYGQGIPVAPSAPMFNPTWDAPITTGQPGYIGAPERAPRGTDKRVLPPTKEPGLWSADQPRAMAEPRSLVIESIPIPLPDEALEDPERVFACERGTAAALNAKKESAGLNRMQPDLKTCTVYLAWRYCMLAEIWGKKGEDAAQRVVDFTDAKMMGEPDRCSRFVDAMSDYLARSFDWNLRAWYHQQYRRGTQ